MSEIKGNQKEANLSSWIYGKFRESMVSKSPETKTWKKCIEAYNGTLYANSNKPSYKSDAVINLVFKTIETIRPIMIDNNPRFTVLARNKEGIDKSSIVQKAMDYEFDRERVNVKLYSNLIRSLTTGNAMFYIPWDADYGQYGNVRCVPVDPYNIYVDPLANNIQDAEYIIYATYMHVNQLKKLYPSRANELTGGAVKYSELVADKDKDGIGSPTQVLVLETWMKDYTYIDVEEEQKDGSMMKVRKRQYPKGRVVVCAPELNLILSDKENPYNDGLFPFIHLKDYDIPFKFWGMGDVEQLLSPQNYVNELNNQIIDNAKHTANMQWIVDRNAGIPQGTLTNRPGLIIRKNPGSEIRRDVPPPMPAYVNDKVQEMKQDMETISGVHDATAGERPTGIQAGNAIIALQEAGQSRIRLKVKLMEECLSDMANMWYARMQQFWKTDRFVRIVKEEGIAEFDKIDKSILKYDYDIKITAGSTMPSNKSAKLDLMIRLAQTIGEDGLPMVDRRSVLEFVDISDKQGLIKRMDERAGKGKLETQFEQFQQQYEADKKQTVDIIQQLTQEVKQVSNQLGSFEKQWQSVLDENAKLKMQKDAEAKGYEKGLKEIPPDLKPDEQMAMQTMRSKNEDDMFEQEVSQGKIPDSVIEELDKMPPDKLHALLKQYPQLEDIINQQQ